MKTVQTGIRLKGNGKYLATKSINGKRFYAEFDKEKDAIKWRKTFNPYLSKKKKSSLFQIPVDFEANGKNKELTFGDVLAMYGKQYLISLEKSTQVKKVGRLNRFSEGLTDIPMFAFNSETITNHLEAFKLKSFKAKSPRFNFEKELKDIKSVFNWYIQNKDQSFSNPVTPIHFKIGKIKDLPPKKKYVPIDEIKLFLDHLPPMYQSLAKVMYILALRVGEAAALSDDTVDFKLKEIHLDYVIVWIKGRPELKRGDKTGTDATMPMSDVIERELLKMKESRPKGCKLFFHLKGKPLRHAQILKVFNKALSDAGLPYTGTHILRHSMATEARRAFGLDASQAILRHSSARMSEHYALADVGSKAKTVITEASKVFSESENRATESDHDETSN